MERKVYNTVESFKAQNTLLSTALPFEEDVSILNTPLNIGSKVIPNRLVCQPMEGCDGTSDGIPDVLTKRRYRRFAEGGAGLIWFEATAVMKEGRANPRQLYICEDNLDSYKRCVSEIKELCLKKNGYEPVVIMQATHSGRYSKPEGVPAPLIAYNNPIFEKDSPISADRIVTDDYLDRVGEALVSGASLAEKAGFDGVDIKCCHRYLNSELLSAYIRDGRYGGSFENRTRLLRESLRGAIENCSSDFIVTSRLNVYDGFPYPYGFGVKDDGSLEFDSTEPVKLIKELSSLGVELLDITMGNPYFNPHVNRPFATGGYDTDEHPLEGVARMLHGIAELKKNVPEMKLIASALTYLGVAAPHVASAFINNSSFDLAGFGRMTFAYPDFASDIIKNGRLEKNKICLCCSKCTHIMRTPGGTPGCVIRDRDPYAELYKQINK
ncbi:MAG: flavin oxidoreductase/NADH oxidase [Clostridia bacterium]|nr:flavin oxidoreductase/NADH oxidase [Clostridia bacterium]